MLKRLMIIALLLVMGVGCDDSSSNDIPVGKIGGDCFPNNSCEEGLFCNSGKCTSQETSMGEEGQPCYTDTRTCNAGLYCNQDSVCEVDNRPAVGTEGGECGYGDYCEKGLGCTNNICVKLVAGELNGPCKSGNSCNGDLVCKNDLCKEAIGGLDQPCYAEERCDLGFVCRSNICKEKSCTGVDCGDWGTCSTISFLCIPNDGYCAKDDHCGNVQHCDDNHQCQDGIKVTTAGAATDEIHLAGDFNDWAKDWKMDYNSETGRYETVLSSSILTNPENGYKFFRYNNGGEDWWFDFENPLRIYDAQGGQNSRLIVPDVAAPRIILLDQPEVTESGYQFTVKYISGNTDSLLDENSFRITLNGETITPQYDSSSKTFTVTVTNVAAGKYSYLFRVKDQAGKQAKALFVPIWVESSEFKWNDAFLYQIMTDRFVDGDAGNNKNAISDNEVKFKADWQGGDFKGITDKLKAGYFTDMGVNALWISSPIINTPGAGKGMGDDPYYYAGFHSYWPIGTGWTDEEPLNGMETPIDPHFGTDAELKELVREAHKRGIRVIVDFVANHVHTDAPIWQEHKDDGWFHRTDGNNENGGYNCGWDRPIECWFTGYLPDFEYKNVFVMKRVVNHAVWMVQEYDFDGFRLDAVKHMIVDFSTTIRTMIQREVVTTGIPFYMVGETFVGEEGYNDIGAYLGADKLDGQFDFPLFYRISNTFFLDNMSLKDLYSFAKYNDTRYQNEYFDGSLMSNFFGNHDIVRAISVANNDFDRSPQGGSVGRERNWSNEPVTPTEALPYKRLMMAQTFLMTSPGIPLIYQGDEFGMPGAHDPDNRRIMIFDDVLVDHQKMALTHMNKLGQFRLQHTALRYGIRQEHWMDDTKLVFSMKDDQDVVVIVFNRTDQDVTIPDVDLQTAGISSGVLVDALGGGLVTVTGGKASFTLSPYSSALYTQQ